MRDLPLLPKNWKRNYSNWILQIYQIHHRKYLSPKFNYGFNRIGNWIKQNEPRSADSIFDNLRNSIELDYRNISFSQATDVKMRNTTTESVWPWWPFLNAVSSFAALHFQMERFYRLLCDIIYVCPSVCRLTVDFLELLATSAVLRPCFRQNFSHTKVLLYPI